MKHLYHNQNSINKKQITKEVGFVFVSCHEFLGAEGKWTVSLYILASFIVSSHTHTGSCLHKWYSDSLGSLAYCSLALIPIANCFFWLYNFDIPLLSSCLMESFLLMTKPPSPPPFCFNALQEYLHQCLPFPFLSLSSINLYIALVLYLMILAPA